MEKWNENRLFWGMDTKCEDFILTLCPQRTSIAEKATPSFEQRTPKGSYGENNEVIMDPNQD